MDYLGRSPAAPKTELGQRLREVRETVSGKDRDTFATLTGIATNTFGNYERGDRVPDAEMIKRYCKATGASAEWLINGDGPMFTRSGDGESSSPGMITIPRYDEVRASAGYGLAVLDETAITRISVELRWLIELGASPASTIILPAGGDSMEPTIRNGAPMFVDTSKTEVRNGHIYVFNVNGDLVVKRIERLFDGSFDLISDNNRYPTRNLSQATIETLTVIGLVLAAVNTF